jgi:hypothetical protein
MRDDELRKSRSQCCLDSLNPTLSSQCCLGSLNPTDVLFFLFYFKVLNVAWAP